MATRNSTVVVIGAGPAGLAISWHLGLHGVDHVVLERGDVANAWRTERWDSLRLLTPNWMSVLPGDARSDDPDGFMAAAEVAERCERYRTRLAAPVHTRTTVIAVQTHPFGFTVDTDDGPWRAGAVVVAAGAAGQPRVPSLANAFPSHLHQVPALRYRNPGDIGSGRVLVVGASASGVQIADELARAGRAVTLAVGDHVRLPRAYRGRDIYWWMDAIGVLDERDDQVADLERARRLPSAQLAGGRRDVDLGALRQRGVTLTGRLAAVRDGDALCSGGLRHLVKSADLKLDRLLDRIDTHIDRLGLACDLGRPERPEPIVLPEPPTRLRLDTFETIVWATGHRPHLPFLPTALLDRRGRVRHHRGVADVPGLYVLGLPVLRRRRSGLIDGIGRDAGDIADLLVERLRRSTRVA
jgi:putative flavoprotein involved in K+ transport